MVYPLQIFILYDFSPLPDSKRLRCKFKGFKNIEDIKKHISINNYTEFFIIPYSNLYTLPEELEKAEYLYLDQYIINLAYNFTLQLGYSEKVNKEYLKLN